MKGRDVINVTKRDNLRRLNMLGNFSAIFTREVTFVTSCLLSYAPGPFQKEVYFFPFTVDMLGANSFLLE